jgi:hypothetical protein
MNSEWSMSYWTKFWMRYAGLGPTGRITTRLAVLFAPPFQFRAPSDYSIRRATSRWRRSFISFSRGSAGTFLSAIAR